MAGLLQTQLNAGKGTTTKLIFTTKSKCYPAGTHINTQPNLHVNHRGDENLPAPRVLPDERLPLGCREKGGNCQHEVPCGGLAAGQRVPVPASPRWNGSSSPAARQHARAPRGTARTPGSAAAAERQKWAGLCQESCGALVQRLLVLWQWR